MDQEELERRAPRGARTAAFLLVIPGSAIVGVGAGMLIGQILPISVLGLGAGMLFWGLIVALAPN
jgi:hypothetical protein